ncbi:MAG: hydrolase 1, exosortase A system-associated [Halieaceae bacterium]|nr:hydrolase 1, exosortase A system-associated [Halieaceae bacterium]MCP4842441.1 hydrolase 1, exosortase A system-associated [Halieaceae bacterium]MDG2410558.1 hydrolase 1, exosortase A system-associated [Halioglobus sp.]
MSKYIESGVVFDRGEDRLVGIVAQPEVQSDVGVLILVGGPQYRVGSHRQFTQLARSLAEAGIASFRFDFAGMGDSEGVRQEFNHTFEDVCAAINAFIRQAPCVSRVVLWGLCDAASSAMIYAPRHPLVSGLVLLNPWVHSGEYAPEVKLTHFYKPFLSNASRWRHLVARKDMVLPALKELGRDMLALMTRRSSADAQPFVHEMLEGVRAFPHKLLILLSGADLTASEFSALISTDADWREAIASPSITIHTVASADHTFSRASWKNEVNTTTISWLNDL